MVCDWLLVWVINQLDFMFQRRYIRTAAGQLASFEAVVLYM